MGLTKNLLATTTAIAGAMLLARTYTGPTGWIRSPLNLESIAFLSFLLCCCLRLSKTVRGDEAEEPFLSDGICLAMIFVVAAAAYFPSLTNPFLFDDYTHLGLAQKEAWGSMIRRALLQHPQSGDFFFRPVGYISYWLDYRWAGLEPVRWHVWNVSLHVVNSVLVYLLCRQLAFRRWGALVSALLFALHACHSEVVAWMAARFDLLAAFFTLATLLALNRYIDSRKAAWAAAMVGCCVLAVLSKEAAFCLPLLALCLIPFQARPMVALARQAGVLAGVCAVVFLYRQWFLGGIGGYRTAAGAPSILSFSLLRTLKGLLYREWAVLFFPVNWSVQPGLALKLAATLFLLAAVWFLARTKRVDSRLLGCLALVFAASLPVQHLVLIGQDLAGARVLYLPSVGLALFWGMLAQGWRSRSGAAWLAGAVLLFQAIVLEHNLRIWRGVAELSRQTCAETAVAMQQDARPITVRGLPSLRNGVFFLKNGFAACVAAASHGSVEASRIRLADAAQPDAEARRFIWDAGAQKLLPDTAGQSK